MLDTLVLLLLAILIVMPVVAILLAGLQRALGREWPPRAQAGAAILITVVLVVAYLVVT